MNEIIGSSTIGAEPPAAVHRRISLYAALYATEAPICFVHLGRDDWNSAPLLCVPYLHIVDAVTR